MVNGRMCVAPPISEEAALAPSTYRPGRCCRTTGENRGRQFGSICQCIQHGVGAAGEAGQCVSAPILKQKQTARQATFARNLSAPPNRDTSLSGISCLRATCQVDKGWQAGRLSTASAWGG